MHEVSLIQNMFSLIEEYSKEYKLKKVNKIVIRVGDLSCVSIESLKFAFSVVSNGTIADGAEFIIEPVTGYLKCISCSDEFAASDISVSCPQCGGPSICIAGRELHLQSLEGTQEEI